MDVKEVYEIFLKCNQDVCTDTRAISAGSLFIALHGANFNGNKFIKKALEAGCRFAISDDPKYSTTENVLVVDDTLATLQELATFHRNKFKIPVLGITGTNGKTTTKELLAIVLSKKFNVLSTAGNFNNHIGVPLTLLKLRQNHEFAIIEMGANHVGDIKELCEIALPNYGVITNIGKAHVEGFGSVENIIKTKTELYDFVESIQGIVFVNVNEEELLKESSRVSNPIFYGGEYLNFELNSSRELLALTIEEEEIESNLFGNYNSNNILTAYKVASYFEVTPQMIKEAVEEYTPTNNRSQMVETKKGNVLILDAYNANPTSMNLAIDEFSIRSEEKVYILGEMKELGKISDKEHLKVMDRLADSSDTIFYVGMAFKKFEKRYKQKFFANIKKLLASKELEKLDNAKILIKGSRSVQLDELESYL